jgi:hypothetical protein
MILQSLAGLPAFLLYFCTAIVAVVAYLFVWVTARCREITGFFFEFYLPRRRARA